MAPVFCPKLNFVRDSPDLFRPERKKVFLPQNNFLLDWTLVEMVAVAAVLLRERERVCVCVSACECACL